MKLYHFTSKHHIDGCIREGLTMGAVPISINPPLLIDGFQWLTRNKSPEQSWCAERILVPYRRDEFRITLKIPKGERKENLIPWLDFCKEYRMPLAKDLNGLGDPENWYLFRGRVSPGWFRGVERYIQ